MMREPSNQRSRNHRSYVAFVGHRLSGLALAIFLPLHFLALALALEGAAALDEFLVFADVAVVKVAEWLLVLFLSVHLFFGLRLLVLELGPWRSGADDRGGLIGWGAGAALALGGVFLLAVF